jgi:hypothetical protein
MTQESIRLMQSAIKITTTVLGRQRRVATDQSTSISLQTLQLQEKKYRF